MPLKIPDDAVAVFTSDIHLTHAHPVKRKLFLKRLKDTGLPVICAGDIADGLSLETELHALANACVHGFYFVPGNHDYWHSGLDNTETRLRRICRDRQNLVLLPTMGAVPLAPGLSLVGPWGWYDLAGRNLTHSMLYRHNDFEYIPELSRCQSSAEAEAVIKAKARDATAQLKTVLDTVRTGDTAVVVSHVPPFPRMNVQWSELWPMYVWESGGRTAVEWAVDGKQVLWLCGHTHDQAEVSIGNVRAVSAAAKYQHPRIQGFLTSDGNLVEAE